MKCECCESTIGPFSRHDGKVLCVSCIKLFAVLKASALSQWEQGAMAALDGVPAGTVAKLGVHARAGYLSALQALTMEV